MKYYILNDNLNKNEIIKEEQGKMYKYSFGAEKWIRNAIMTHYTWPEDVRFGMYDVIPEDKALQMMNKQRELLDELLVLAIDVATKAHEGQVDKGGNPYILHPKAVADSLNDTEDKIVAYLHDVCEDTDTTLDDLINMGFTYRIVSSVRILTKTKDTSYDKYLKQVKKDSNAWHVKMADLKHNMDISRIPHPTKKDFERVEKYKNALSFLEA